MEVPDIAMVLHVAVPEAAVKGREGPKTARLQRTVERSATQVCL